MKQTAVEWFYEQILLTPLDIRSINKCLEQAKEMEKEQIIDAFFEGKNDGILMERYSDYKHISPDEYYNENFKSE
jgi:hypothetical protein